MTEPCPKCGSEMYEEFSRSVDADGNPERYWVCPLDPKDCRIKELETTLTADSLQTVLDLKRQLSAAKKMTEFVESENDSLRELLSAEQSAHAATKEELRQVDEALIEYHESLDHTEFRCQNLEEWAFSVYADALARQSQRAAQSDAAKEE